MQRVEIPINTPIPVTLASLDGVIVDSQFGPAKKQMKFSTAPDGKPLYVPTWVGDKIKAEGARAIRLTKRQDAQRKIAWQVERIEAGEQHDGTFAIPKEKPETVSPPQVHSVSGFPPVTSSNDRMITPSIAKPDGARKRFLWDQGRELIDAQAALMRYAAEKHGGSITRDDVRALVVTVYIQSRMMRGR